MEKFLLCNIAWGEANLSITSAHPLSFNFNGLNSSFRSHFLSIRWRNMETRVYVGDRSSGRIYDPIYTGKLNLAHIYEALYVIVTKLYRVQVCEQYFERVLTQKMVSPLQDGY
jgi:hypothetical protein